MVAIEKEFIIPTANSVCVGSGIDKAMMGPCTIIERESKPITGSIFSVSAELLVDFLYNFI